jgi:uncharacterized protein
VSLSLRAMLTPPLPRYPVDPRKLASQDVELHAVEAVSSFSRLAGLLANDQGEVTIDLAFRRDESKLICIDGHVSGVLQVPCQRCLEAMPLVVDSHFHAAMVKNDEQAARIPRAYEPVMVDEAGLELLPIVEDELILCVPYANYHELDDCAVKIHSPESEADDTEAPELKRPNPFTVLAGLNLNNKTDNKT